MSPPRAVLLDVGGVFLLPEHERIVGAFERGGCNVAADVLDDAHYRAAATFTTHLDVDADRASAAFPPALDAAAGWRGSWGGPLGANTEACKCADAGPEEGHRHVDSEFADAALWMEVIPGSREGLRAVADTGVLLGVVSNADGIMGERLRRLEILQVGPGLGVEVSCVIDSGAVGVMKPDPLIYRLALEAIGVAAEDAWYIGDMPAIDVVGAWRAGIRPFLMDPLELHVDADYDRVG